MNFITEIGLATWHLLKEMAPYLLFGYLIAGILHLLLPKEKVTKHLSENSVGAVLKASLLGVPLPLCSCGVIPVAAHLEKQGAKKGPVLSFLTSTPTTGVDSILATYALLGPLLAIMRPIAALFNGMLVGILANIGEKDKPSSTTAPIVDEAPDLPKTLGGRAKAIFQYAFIDLVDDTAKWLIIGILAGGVISFAIPSEFVGSYLSNPYIAYPMMLLIGIPMYVCATGSIPIAASLILKGMSPGAGFIFLFAGPATNTATLSFVGGKLGKKDLVLYLGTILVTGLIFGGIIDYIWLTSGETFQFVGGAMTMLPSWLNISSSIILLLLIGRSILPKGKKEMSAEGKTCTVSDMTCDHCKKTIDRALRADDAVEDVTIDVENKKVQVVGNISADRIFEIITKAGYQVEA